MLIDSKEVIELEITMADGKINVEKNLYICENEELEIVLSVKNEELSD